MQEQDKTGLYLAIMQMNEMLAQMSEFSKRISKIEFKDLTPEMWALIVAQQGPLQAVLDTMVEKIPGATKVVANDAVSAHIEAVMSAD